MAKRGRTLADTGRDMAEDGRDVADTGRDVADTGGTFFTQLKFLKLALHNHYTMPEKKEKKTKVAEIKTKETDASVEDFLNAIPEEQKRKDSFAIVEMMQQATGDKPKMWGPAIVGFGNTRYKSERSGREVDWMKIGFSPRKANLTLYIGIGAEYHAEALEKLGKHKTGKGCLYINKLADVDLKVLKAMIDRSAKQKATE